MNQNVQEEKKSVKMALWKGGWRRIPGKERMEDYPGNLD